MKRIDALIHLKSILTIHTNATNIDDEDLDVILMEIEGILEMSPNNGEWEDEIILEDGLNEKPKGYIIGPEEGISYNGHLLKKEKVIES